MKISQTLFLAAIAGALAIAAVACGDDKPAADPSSVDAGGATTTSTSTTTTTTPATDAGK